MSDTITNRLSEVRIRQLQDVGVSVNDRAFDRVSANWTHNGRSFSFDITGMDFHQIRDIVDMVSDAHDDGLKMGRREGREATIAKLTRALED